MTNPLEPMMADLIARIERGVPPWRQARVACADPSLPLRSDGQPFTGSNGWLSFQTDSARAIVPLLLRCKARKGPRLCKNGL